MRGWFPPTVNPEGIASSSPGLRGTSYPGKSCKPPLNPNGVVAALDTLGHNSDGVGSHCRGVPRVAPPLFLGRGISTAVAHCKHLGCINGEGLSERAGSQPWALLRNPFGIKRDRKALRRLRDQKLSPIPAQTPTFRKNRIQSVNCKIF